jgi:hypothetical protein
LPDDRGRARGMEGPWVLPGEYTARLQRGTQRLEQAVQVLEDPRIRVTEEQRVRWHERVMALAQTLRSFLVTADTVGKIQDHIDDLSEQQKSSIRDVVAEVAEIAPLVSELRSRLMRLYGEVGEWPAPFTADEQSQLDYFEEWIRRLEPRVSRVAAAELP